MFTLSAIWLAVTPIERDIDNSSNDIGTQNMTDDKFELQMVKAIHSLIKTATISLILHVLLAQKNPLWVHL